MKKQTKKMKILGVMMAAGLSATSLNVQAEIVAGRGGPGLFGAPTLSPVYAISTGSRAITLEPISATVRTGSDFGAPGPGSVSTNSASPFSSELLFFLSGLNGPRWGGNSAAFAYHNLLLQTFALSPSGPVPVPLPAAGLLFMSALGGLAGFARKRKTNSATAV